MYETSTRKNKHLRNKILVSGKLLACISVIMHGTQFLYASWMHCTCCGHVCTHICMHSSCYTASLHKYYITHMLYNINVFTCYIALIYIAIYFIFAYMSFIIALHHLQSAHIALAHVALLCMHVAVCTDTLTGADCRGWPTQQVGTPFINKVKGRKYFLGNYVWNLTQQNCQSFGLRCHKLLTLSENTIPRLELEI